MQYIKARHGGIPEWLKGADCKSASSAFGGSNPPPTTIFDKSFAGIHFPANKNTLFQNIRFDSVFIYRCASRLPSADGSGFLGGGCIALRDLSVCDAHARRRFAPPSNPPVYNTGEDGEAGVCEALLESKHLVRQRVAMCASVSEGKPT